MNLHTIQEIENLDIKTLMYITDKLKVDLEIKTEFVRNVENELLELQRIENAKYRVLIPRHEECIKNEKVKIDFMKDLISDYNQKIAFLKGFKGE